MDKEHPNISVLQKFNPTNIAGAADILAEEGIDIEVIDPRTLRPLDTATLIKSVIKTGQNSDSERKLIC